MGVYFNPNNESFRQARNSMVYVDKTCLIDMLNKRLSTEQKCIAVSHARRFGKSHAAGMIDAYYSIGCDSTKLFEDKKLSAKKDFKKYMNQYNVIHLDISSVWDFHKEDLIESIHDRICDDFKEEYGEKINYDRSSERVHICQTTKLQRHFRWHLKPVNGAKFQKRYQDVMSYSWLRLTGMQIKLQKSLS